MNNLKQSMSKNYWKDDQWLLFETWYDGKQMKKEKEYFSQEIFYKDYSLCTIKTWDILKYNESISYSPYCIKNHWGGYTITVPKFGQLTDYDIEKAIRYILRKMDLFGFFNMKLDGKRFKYYTRPIYQTDLETLRWLHENK